MKYQIQISTAFNRDLRLIERQGKDLSKLKAVIDTLANGERLAEQHRDHALHGNYDGYRECHIAPDWLLIYKYNNNELILLLTRTGSHSTLFKK